ncbi:zinc ribbon domain-containing protein [Alteromonas sp. M12]|uniref:zinc ribbon domain-containing protein n=1 Tax=Alteromonas sp. M12 TaxID=3135644 RepID=UPI00319E92AA
MNKGAIKYLCIWMLSTGYLMLGVIYYAVIAKHLNISTEYSILLLIIPGLLAYIYYLTTTEKTFTTHQNLKESTFNHATITQSSQFWRVSFNIMLMLSGVYFVLYLNAKGIWQQGISMLFGLSIALLLVRIINKFVSSKLNSLSSLIVCILVLLLFLFIIHNIEMSFANSDRSFPQFLLIVLFGLCTFLIIVYLSDSAGFAFNKIWLLFRRFSYEYTLIKNGSNAEKNALYDLKLYFLYMLNQRVYIAVLIAPLYFALSAHVDIRRITVIWLVASFFPICLKCSRYVSQLASTKYFLILTVTFHFLFWSLVIWAVFLQLSFYLYCVITQWYWDSSFASNSLIPNFLLAFNNPITKDILYAQLEGVFYAFILLIQIVYFLAAIKTKKFKRAIAQIVTLTSFACIVAYNQYVSLEFFDNSENSLFTPAIILLTVIPIVIDLISQSMRQINAQYEICHQCQQPNKSIYNFCQLCGGSLFGARNKLDLDCHFLLNRQVEQLSEQIKQNKYNLKQASELLRENINGMQTSLKTTRNQITLDEIYKSYLVKMQTLVNSTNSDIDSSKAE